MIVSWAASQLAIWWEPRFDSCLQMVAIRKGEVLYTWKLMNFVVCRRCQHIKTCRQFIYTPCIILQVKWIRISMVWTQKKTVLCWAQVLDILEDWSLVKSVKTLKSELFKTGKLICEDELIVDSFLLVTVDLLRVIKIIPH